ncbi:MAG: recombinase family protein [Comamonas sp.]|nr:recombinase family protein [Candidatus Comamonas equi]
MSRLAYYRVSTAEQSIAAQRAAMGDDFDKEFTDEGVSGATKAADRPGFSELLRYARAGDVIHVYAVDRLGRDALDVQATVRDFLNRGIEVEIFRLGRIAPGVGELILAVLAQVADMERQRIVERTAAGRDLAVKTLIATGKTHRGKTSMGRPMAADPEKVSAWREANSATISQTAEHFGISTATVKRHSRRDRNVSA